MEPGNVWYFLLIKILTIDYKNLVIDQLTEQLFGHYSVEWLFKLVGHICFSKNLNKASCEHNDPFVFFTKPWFQGAGIIS